MVKVVDFLKRLYRRRKHSTDPVLRELYADAEGIQYSPRIMGMRADLKKKFDYPELEFDKMWVSYTASLKMSVKLSGKDQDWNADVEELLRQFGTPDEEIKTARTDFDLAVYHRIRLRIHMAWQASDTVGELQSAPDEDSTMLQAAVALQKGDLKLAFKHLQQAAERGHPEAQFELGVMYRQGEGTAKDAERAAYWYQKAADQNFHYAEYNLGTLYLKGEGVPTDFEKFLEYTQRAAEHGNIDAAYKLAEVMYLGDKTYHNLEGGAQWLNAAANGGHLKAQFECGVTKYIADSPEAVGWFSYASQNGYGPAKNLMSYVTKEEVSIFESDVARLYILRSAGLFAKLVNLGEYISTVEARMPMQEREEANKLLKLSST